MSPFYTGIQLRTQVFVVLIGVVMLALVFHFLRRKQLREQYSLLWIFSAALLLLTAVFIRQVDQLAGFIGIYYPPAFLFLVAILVVFTMQFHFSTVISSLREHNKTLTQSLGILDAEVRELKKRLDGRS